MTDALHCPIDGCTETHQPWPLRTHLVTDHNPDELLKTVPIEAHPAHTNYRVHLHFTDGWGPISSPRPTLDDTVAQMNLRRSLHPDWPPMRVIEIRTTYTVITTETEATP